MTIEQMKEGLKTIELLEKDLMRDLTKEEKDVVMNEGWEKFLFGEDHLNFTEEDYKELKALKEIISAFYTQDEAVLEECIEKAPEGIAFVLKDILDRLDANTLCSDPYKDKEECHQTETPVKKSNPIDDFVIFLEDLYDAVPKREKDWFNKLTEDIRKDLFKVFRENRNEHQDCSDDILGGIITDAVKDGVVKDMVEKLKKGEAVEMTNDEYMEVADYLCQHEDHIFLSNENGTVRLTLL